MTSTTFRAGLSLLVCAALLHSAACASRPLTPPSAAALTQAAAPAGIGADIRRSRPYTAASIWNTPIGAAPTYDTHSAEMVATIGTGITSDPSQYTFPVYFTDASTPRWDIPCLEYRCTLVSPQAVTAAAQISGVPIPSDARPAGGGDAQLIVIDTVTGAEYNLYHVQRTSTGWTVGNGSIYNILWDGMPARYGSRGAGVPYYAGLVRPWEILQGRIDHALAFGYPDPSDTGCVFPATKTDGSGRLPYALPEGARLQLDPTLTEADFDAWGLSSTGQVIARALQEYGMFLIDHSGRPKIYVEDLVDNPYATQQWNDAALNLTSTTIASIPYTAFRVIALPASYWNPALDGPMHGRCYAYPQ